MNSVAIGKSYKCLIHSNFEIYIYFDPQRRRSKNETILYSVLWLSVEIHGGITDSGVCVCFFKVFIKIPGGGGYSLQWPIRGGSARKGYLFQASGIKKGRNFTS